MFSAVRGGLTFAWTKVSKSPRRDVRSATRNRQFLKIVAVVIHELIVLTPKITVQQRKLITMILPLFLDFSVSHSVAQTFVLEKNRRKVSDCSLLN